MKFSFSNQVFRLMHYRTRVRGIDFSFPSKESRKPKGKQQTSEFSDQDFVCHKMGALSNLCEGGMFVFPQLRKNKQKTKREKQKQQDTVSCNIKISRQRLKVSSVT